MAGTTTMINTGVKKGKASSNHRWTDEEMDIVRCEYRGTVTGTVNIAQRLTLMTGERITAHTVKSKAGEMGISRHHDRRPWTPEEDEALCQLIGSYTPRTVAQKMGRSVNSVLMRAYKLRYSRRARNGWYTKKEVCEILGVNQRWVQKRIDTGTLKASCHDPESLPRQSERTHWHIDEEDLRGFIRKYPQDLTGRNVDLITIVEILAGLL